MTTQRFMTTTEAAEELGMSPGSVRNLCLKGRIVGARKFQHVWMVPTPVKVKDATTTVKGHVTIPEAARMMGISRQRLYRLIDLGRIVGVKRKGKSLLIPLPIQRIRKGIIVNFSHAVEPMIPSSDSVRGDA